MVLGLLVMLWNCGSCIYGCCCKPKHKHHKEAKEKRDPPPTPSEIKAPCTEKTILHIDWTYLARRCGKVPVIKGERHKWNFWGHVDGWWRSVARGEWRWPWRKSPGHMSEKQDALHDSWNPSDQTREMASDKRQVRQTDADYGSPVSPIFHTKEK